MTPQSSHATFSAGPAAIYERYFVPAVAAPLAHDLVELAELRSGERVVDVACGTGVVTRLAAERVGADAVVGVDINPRMLRVAREVAAETTIEWREASADALPLEDASFDVAFCQMGLQFVPDRPGALREILRVLRPGGRVLLNVPGPTPPMFAALEQALRRHVSPEAGQFVATVFSLHDEDELGELLDAAGFTGILLHFERRTLNVSTAEDFLWQYLYGTPLAGAAWALDEQRRADFQHDVVTAWEPFAEDDGMILEVEVTSATARAA